MVAKNQLVLLVIFIPLLFFANAKYLEPENENSANLGRRKTTFDEEERESEEINVSRILVKGLKAPSFVLNQKICITLFAYNERGESVPIKLPNFFWRLSILSTSSEGNETIIVAANVRYVRSKGGHSACFILPQERAYRIEVQLQSSFLRKLSANARRPLAKVFNVIAKRKAGVSDLQTCSPELIARNHNLHGSWSGNAYQPGGCVLNTIGPREAMSCVGGKVIGVFADSSLKAWLSYFVRFLGGDKINRENIADNKYIRASYEMAWSQSYFQNSIPFGSQNFSQTIIPVLDLYFGPRSRASLYGTGWSGYGTVEIDPPCEKQRDLEIWMFGRSHSAEPLFQPWMLNEGRHQGLPWLTPGMKFDHIILSSSVLDLETFGNPDEYADAVRLLVQRVRGFVEPSSKCQVVWLGSPAIQPAPSGIVADSDPAIVNNDRLRSFNDAAFKVMKELGVIWLDTAAMTFPRPDLSLDGRRYSWPVKEAVSQLLLNLFCKASELKSPDDDTCHDRESVVNLTLPAQGPREYPVQLQMKELIREAAEDDFESEDMGRSDQEGIRAKKSARDWPPADLLDTLNLGRNLPGKRRVLLSFDQLRNYLKKHKQGATEGAIRLQRSTEVEAGDVEFERATRLEHSINREHFNMCFAMRKECHNGGRTVRSCFPRDNLTKAVAAGVVLRCEKWCPSDTRCWEAITRKGPLHLNRAIQRLPMQLPKPTMLAFFNDVFISSAGDVYTEKLLLDPRGECYDLKTAKWHLRIDPLWAVQHAHRKVYVATSYGTGWYQTVFDSLTRLMPYYKGILNDPTIMVHIRGFEDGLSIPDYVIPAFQFLGIEAKRIIWHDVYAGEAIIGEAPCRAPFQPREIFYMRNLRSTIHARLRQMGVKAPTGLGTIILTQNKWHRRVSNLELLAKVLREKTGRSVISVEDDGRVDVGELWPLFFRADLVVGPYGNGLVNMIACRPGTAVLEFMQPFSDNLDPANVNIEFELIATSLGYPHYVTIPKYHNPNTEGLDEDPRFILDLNKIVGYVLRILKDKESGGWEKLVHVEYFEAG